MKNLLFSLSVIAMLFSCSSSDDDNSNNNSSSINPPTWIQGTWLANGINIGVKFTSDDFCTINVNETSCTKEAIEQSNNSGQNIVVNEVVTDDFYSIEIDYNNHLGSIMKYEFEKVSDSEIGWITTTGTSIYIKQ